MRQDASFRRTLFKGEPTALTAPLCICIIAHLGGFVKGFWENNLIYFFSIFLLTNWGRCGIIEMTRAWVVGARGKIHSRERFGYRQMT